MKQIRCPKCRKLLLKMELEGTSHIEIKCPRCVGEKEIMRFTIVA